MTNLHISSFNSKVVRLKDKLKAFVKVVKMFQFQSGAIKRTGWAY